MSYKKLRDNLVNGIAQADRPELSNQGRVLHLWDKHYEGVIDLLK